MFAIAMMIGMVSFAQQKTTFEENQATGLIDATYYHENGQISQMGSYTKEGKLQGIWTSYDVKGNKVALGNYSNGKKVGKWLFWSNNKLKEVDYVDSKITNVSEWSDKTQLVVSN